MKTLREKQSEFARKIAVLKLVAVEMGYEITDGHAYRCPDCTTGRKKSVHKLRLAEDIHLFRDGEYLSDGTGHEELHDIWDQIGGAPRIPHDLNHYSFKHEGTW